jgi:hypothetical protein
MRSFRDALLALAFLVVGLIVAAVTWDFVHERTFGQDDGETLADDPGPHSKFGLNEPAEPEGERPPLVWIKFTLVSLDDLECRPTRLRSGRELNMVNDSTQLTTAEADELLAHLRRLPSFQVVGGASVETQDGKQALIQFVDDVRYFVEGKHRPGKEGAPPTVEPAGETDQIGLRHLVTTKVGDDGRLVTLELFVDATFLAGWTRVQEFREPLAAGWSWPTSITVANGGCCVVTGLDPKVLAAGGEAARRFGRRKGILLVAARIIPFDEKEPQSDAPTN